MASYLLKSNDEEKERWEKCAKHDNMSLAAWIRLQLNAGADAYILSEELDWKRSSVIAAVTNYRTKEGRCPKTGVPVHECLCGNHKKP